MACKAGDLLAMKKDEGRSPIKDKRVVYIYHDTIDAIGDDSKTEDKTFHGRAEGHRGTGVAGGLHRQ